MPFLLAVLAYMGGCTRSNVLDGDGGQLPTEASHDGVLDAAGDGATESTPEPHGVPSDYNDTLSEDERPPRVPIPRPPAVADAPSEVAGAQAMTFVVKRFWLGDTDFSG